MCLKTKIKKERKEERKKEKENKSGLQNKSRVLQTMVSPYRLKWIGKGRGIAVEGCSFGVGMECGTKATTASVCFKHQSITVKSSRSADIQALAQRENVVLTCDVTTVQGTPTLRASLSAPSSKLCQIWLRHWRGTLYLRAAVHRRSQRPPKGSGTNMTVEQPSAQART